MGKYRKHWIRLIFLGLSVLVCAPVPVGAVRKTRLTWVNGIAYSIEHMEEGKGKISELFGGKPVLYCYNPTAMSHDDDLMGYIGDLTQASTQKLGRITGEVDALVKHLKEAVASVGRKGRVIHIAHSQGALVTSLAAKQLSPLEMSQIEVLAFGGAAALRKTPQTPFRRCVNYYSVNDPLLYVVPSASQALKSGFVADGEFCFLTPRMGDPIQDHNLLGPTYASALAWEGHRFQRKYQSLSYRLMRPIFIYLWLAMSASKDALADRTRRLLELIVFPVIRLFLLVLAWLRTNLKHIHRLLIANTLKPALLVVILLVQWVVEFIRIMKKEDKFVPVKPNQSPVDNLETQFS